MQNEARLNSDQFGKFICNNLSLGLFKRNKEQWLGSFDKAKKAKELFSDFLTPPAKLKKDKMKKEDFEEVKMEEDFVIDNKGDENLLKRPKQDMDESEESSPKKKKKEKATSSYLDDL